MLYSSSFQCKAVSYKNKTLDEIIIFFTFILYVYQSFFCCCCCIIGCCTSSIGGKGNCCLRSKSETREMDSKWIVSLKELKKVCYIAAPMVAVMVLLQLLHVVSVMMVGHLDELSLSGVSIATSFAIVTGFCFLFGMSGALETLCGQAYGAGQYQKIGTYTYCAIINLIIVCFPIAILWAFTEKILTLIGQDPAISHVAYKYALSLIPALFAYAILQALVRYFQTQSLILPMLFSSLAALFFHIPFCWTLIFKSGLGTIGAALSIGLSYWLNVILLGFYIKYSSKCDKSRATLSTEVLQSTRVFFRFAVPSAAMVCLEWWASEVLIFLSGLLPNPKMEASVLSICFSIISLHFFIPCGIGATASTRVANELGAGNPEAAKLAVWITIVISTVEGVFVSTILFFCRYILGYAFSSEKEVVNNVADMVPIMCLQILVDCLQAVLSGVARGCGRQNTAAFANLGAYYLVGIPVAAVLAFVLHFKVKGLFIGQTTGSSSQVVILGLVTVFTNWQKQASRARKRMLEEDANNETELTGGNTLA
ncbi:protein DETOXIFICATION 14-like [Durio zibethinus]|uniref:Protein DETOXIFICATION n=1 Tax=Durio zibethinus TaxID=66656 RepID=A0A6P5Y1J9_DURZI|nr:protein DETOXIFICATION 14-like [Durio zibethinus]